MTFTQFAAAACRVAAIAAALWFQPQALAQTPAHTPAHLGDTMEVMGAASSMPAGAVEMKSMMKDMVDHMTSVPLSGNPDVDFAMMMRILHQGAIDMAQTELRTGKEPKMRQLAKDIIAVQKKEIAEIDRFLVKGHSGHKMKK